MRLWSIHPKYLDTNGFIALWREALLAQSVLKNNSKGYSKHPQLNRFKKEKDPLISIGSYLRGVFLESQRRGYSFDNSKILFEGDADPIPVTTGQIEFEWAHLLNKLSSRSTNIYSRNSGISVPDTHPLFKVIEGRRESWEIVKEQKIVTMPHKRPMLLALLNEMVGVLKPIKYETLNVFWEADKKYKLLDLEFQHPKLGIRPLDYKNPEDSPWGVSSLSIISSIIDYLLGKKLGVELDDNGIIIGFIFVDKSNEKKKITS